MKLTLEEIEEYVRRRRGVNTEMTREELEEFLKGRSMGMLATNRRDGPPQMRPIWYDYDGGVISMWTSIDTAKLRNIMRDSRVSFCIQDEAWPYRGVTVQGRAEIIHRGRGSVPKGQKIAHRYIGEEAGDRFVDLITDESYVILTVTPEKFASWDNTKAPPYSEK